MYELIQLTEHDYYIDCPAKVGVVVYGTDAYLIDGGSDKDVGKKILKHLEANGWTLKAIFNTHSHADHIGGNRLLQERTGCRVYAADGLERVYTGTTVLEPIGLYGGLPFRELQSKFLLAQPSEVLPLTGDVLPEGMKTLPLPGHSDGMTGFLTADGTAYIGDCVSSEETLNKYGIVYLWDTERALRSLETLSAVEAKRFVPAHAPVTDDIRPLAAKNAEAINGVKERIRSFLSEPISFEELLKLLFDACAMKMTAQQYALIGSTVRSYLTGLYTNGEVNYRFAENRMLWYKL